MSWFFWFWHMSYSAWNPVDSKLPCGGGTYVDQKQKREVQLKHHGGYGQNYKWPKDAAQRWLIQSRKEGMRKIPICLQIQESARFVPVKQQKAICGSLSDRSTALYWEWFCSNRLSGAIHHHFQDSSHAGICTRVKWGAGKINYCLWQTKQNGKFSCIHTAFYLKPNFRNYYFHIGKKKGSICQHLHISLQIAWR